MAFAVDKSLHWTDHYVEHGFAVIKRAVGPEFTRPAMEEVKKVIGTDLPPREWTHEKQSKHIPIDGKNASLLLKLYDQPGVRAMIDAMFGSAREWNHQRAFQLFTTAFNPDIKPAVSSKGHIDFVRCPVPILGSGFTFQVSLIDSEPFSGNITIYPGAHKRIQKRLMENPALQWPTDTVIDNYMAGEAFEFVAEEGDLMIFHHLVGHAGNQNHAARRTPRVVLHCQAQRNDWLREVDPANIRFGAWERSLATNGRYVTVHDEEQWIKEYAKTRTSKPEAAYT